MLTLASTFAFAFFAFQGRRLGGLTKITLGSHPSGQLGSVDPQWLGKVRIISQIIPLQRIGHNIVELDGGAMLIAADFFCGCMTWFAA